MGPNPIRLSLHTNIGVSIKRKNVDTETHTEERRHEARGRRWPYNQSIPRSQRRPRIANIHQKPEGARKDSPLEPVLGETLISHL